MVFSSSTIRASACSLLSLGSSDGGVAESVLTRHSPLREVSTPVFPCCQSIAIEQIALEPFGRHPPQPQVLRRGLGELPPPPRPRQKPDLQQVRLDHILQRPRILVERGGGGFGAAGAAFGGGGGGSGGGGVGVGKAEGG